MSLVVRLEVSKSRAICSLLSLLACGLRYEPSALKFQLQLLCLLSVVRQSLSLQTLTLRNRNPQMNFSFYKLS